MDKKTISEKLVRLNQLRDELFDLANECASAKHGYVAGELHESCNAIFRATKGLNEGVTPIDELKQLNKWFDDRAMPIGPEERKQLFGLLMADKHKN